MSTSARKKAQRQAELAKAKKQREHEKLFASPKKKSKSTFKEYTPNETYRRETPDYPSFKPSEASPHSTARRESKRYTGTLVRGIATLHKSNAVPVISDEHAIEISRMRRG